MGDKAGPVRNPGNALFTSVSHVSLALMKLRVEQCFPCSLYIGSNLVRTCCRIGPKLHHVGPDLGWAYMLGAHLGRLGPTPTWAQLGLQLTLHGIELRHVRPTCAGTPRVGPSWSQMVQVGPKLGPSWAQVGPSLCSAFAK